MRPGDLVQNPEEAGVYNVFCNDTSVVAWTTLPDFPVSKVAVSNKSLTLYGYKVCQTLSHA